MFLTEKYAGHLSPLDPFLWKKPSSPPDAAGAVVARSFEEALLSRLRSLLPVSGTLAWLSSAASVLSATLSDASGILSDASLSATDRTALASHLDSGLGLLDACNAASAAIDRSVRRRLLLRLAIHLLSSPDSLARARAALADWNSSSNRGASRSDPNLIRRIVPGEPARGKISAVRRVIYAVEALSGLVACSILAALGEEVGDLPRIHASSEFPWAEAFNKVAAEVSTRAAAVVEVEATMEAAVTLAAAIEAEGDGGKTESIRVAAEKAEKAAEGLTEGMDRLAGAVNELFREALAIRNVALQSFRVAPQKCK